ncbi:MAG: hypothetical protein EXR69_07005 [Myxococcales bacterium]|nr:hypothetical protein [Myxococcales bacterium]
MVWPVSSSFSFSGASFSGASFSGASFSGASFSGASGVGPSLAGVVSSPSGLLRPGFFRPSGFLSSAPSSTSGASHQCRRGRNTPSAFDFSLTRSISSARCTASVTARGVQPSPALTSTACPGRSTAPVSVWSSGTAFGSPSMALRSAAMAASSRATACPRLPRAMASAACL